MYFMLWKNRYANIYIYIYIYIYEEVHAIKREEKKNPKLIVKWTYLHQMKSQPYDFWTKYL
ncbi:hypothetical protein ACMBCM_08945, partial [Spiroplasma sp. K1]